MCGAIHAQKTSPLIVLEITAAVKVIQTHNILYISNMCYVHKYAHIGCNLNTLGCPKGI